MTERCLDLNGSMTFVDDRGAADAPALLYVHGGPGLGCYDFMHVQGDRMQELGEHYQDLFFDEPAEGRAFEQLQSSAGFGDETWGRGGSHEPLWEDMYTDRLPALSRVVQPTLLLRGEADRVTSPSMLQRYSTDVTDGRTQVLPDAGHSPAHEAPERYASVVIPFVVEVGS